VKTRPTLSRLSAKLLCACALLACVPMRAQNLPMLGDTERQDLSPALERKLGEEVMHDLRRNVDYLDDAPLIEYLNTFGSQLLSARPDVRGEANYDFFFFAVRDPMINAFALPGGFIAMHSALMLAAQTESELASVMSHEIGHVAQRHIARMIGKQKQDSLIPIAAAILAALAASKSPDAAAALAVGGQGLAIQRQLAFSRDAEREADRVGFQILQAAGFDTSGMVAFFARMQRATSAYSDNIPAFLLSHPLTTERMADIDARNRDTHYRQRIDSIDFHLIRARVRVLQDESGTGQRDAETIFNNQVAQPNWQQAAAGHYGLAVVAFRQGRFDQAEAQLHEARLAAARAPAPTPRVPAGTSPELRQSDPIVSLGAALAASAGVTAAKPDMPEPQAPRATFSGGVAARDTAKGAFSAGAQPAQNPIFTALAVDIALARAESGGAAEKQAAIRAAETGHQQYPLSRGIARQYADTLFTAKQYDKAGAFLRDQLQQYRAEPQLYERLAKVYSATGKRALQHMALAESYALTGGTQAALEQLEYARKAGDATYYDHSVIDARERTLQARRKDELKDAKERG
jgi:predicted Zn-dependent protease